MNEEKQTKTSGCDFEGTVDRFISSEVTVNFGKAFREVLVGMRSVIDTVIEKREPKPEAKVQKVPIE